MSRRRKPKPKRQKVKLAPDSSGSQTQSQDEPRAQPRRRLHKRVLWLIASAALIVAIVLAARFSRTVTPSKPAAAAHLLDNSPIRFDNRQGRSGVDFLLNSGTTKDKPIIDSTLGGVSLLDYNNDGFLDIFFTNGAHIPTLKKTDPSFHNRLYRSEGNGSFSDVTSSARVSGEGYSMGVAAGDFDNDGWVDLYLTGVRTNTLYHNNGDGTFRDVTQSAGVSGRLASGKKPWSVAATWFDYDRDGDLDLLVVNYLDWSFANNQVCGEPGKRLSCPPGLYEGVPNSLYRNDGDGTFADVSTESGMGAHVGKGMSAAVADYDGDGWIDVFVTNDGERDFLFRNLEGRTFREMGVQAAVALTEDGMPVSSMGVDFRDLNGDGRPDIWVTALASQTFPLFLNQGGGLFLDAAYETQIGLSATSMSGWGNGAYDFDNDGYKDLFTANSHVSENIQLYRHYEYKLPNAVFRNQGDGTFRDVTGKAGPAMNVARPHRGCAFGDLNNDGRVDVVVSVIGEKPEVLYNSSPVDHHWILIELEGTQSNRDAIGTEIRVTGESGFPQYNHVTTSVGYASASDKRAHFGLGSDTLVREIELRWPSGKVQVLEDVPVDQILRIKED